MDVIIINSYSHFINITSGEIYVLFVFSILFTLFVYHLILYFGRKKRDKENLYYSAYAFCTIIHLLLSCSTRRFILPDSLRFIISPSIVAISFALMMHFSILLLAILFALNKNIYKTFLPSYISYLIVVILAFAGRFVGQEFYIKYFKLPLFLIATFGSIYYIVVFAKWILKNKIYGNKPALLTFLGLLLLFLDFIIERVLTELGMSYLFRQTYILTGVSVFMYAIALMFKYNEEYEELEILKNHLQDKVKERTKELEEANEQRLNTFINLAHEIRTPITLIKNYLGEYIGRHGEDEEMRVIRSNIDKLNADIVNCFNEERFLKGMMPAYNHNQITDFSSLLKGKLSLFNKYAKHKNIELTGNAEANIYAKADPDALDSIINNLLENAIKYTPEGGHVLVSLATKEGHIRFSVKDDGHGIPEELQSKVFEPYFQASREKKNIQGMGMGLAIVSNIVKSLDAKIELDSKDGKGCEFTVTLKQHVISENDVLTSYEPKTAVKINLSADTIKDAAYNRSKPSVFVIEDNYDMLLYLRNKLQEKFNVFVAENGKKALEKLKTGPRPDLFISDVMMDEMDGFKLYGEISNNTAYRHVPLIFLTAKTTTMDKLKGLSLGAVDYIHKPFSIEELIQKAESIINASRKQKEAILSSAMEYINNNLYNKEPSDKVDVTTTDSFDTNCQLFGISSREKEIIRYIADGLTYKEISVQLFISERTVQKHCENVFSKVGVNSKLDLIRKLNGH